MIYLHDVPKALEHNRNAKLRGQVTYRDHTVRIPANAVNDQFVQNLGQRKTPKSGEPKRAAVYVDELLPVEERQQELVNILRNVVKNPEHYDGIIVYGSPTTDVNEHVKDAIALLTEHGTEVTFIQ